MTADELLDEIERRLEIRVAGRQGIELPGKVFATNPRYSDAEILDLIRRWRMITQASSQR